MDKINQLLELIEVVKEEFSRIKDENFIVKNSLPILWFGNCQKFLKSDKKIITVSLNPSDAEFKTSNSAFTSYKYKFPSYRGSVNSLYKSYNEYFRQEPYSSWFKASFKTVLESFSASHYYGKNVAIHTDFGSPFATNPTWSKLSKSDRAILEGFGSKTWHNLVRILEPDIILFSASEDFESKIEFHQKGDWKSFDVKTKRPLKVGKFVLDTAKEIDVLFQVQGRKPFLQTSKEEKLKFSSYLLD